MADEFKIVASLDIPNSADRINKVDIPDLEKRLKPIQILAELDTKSVSNIQTQLNTLTNQAKAPTVKIGVDTSGLNSVQSATQNITNSLQTVQTQAQQTSKSIHEISTQMKNFKFPVVTMNDKGGNTITDTVKTLQNARDMFSKLGFTNVKFTWADEAGGVFDRLTAKVTDSYGAVQNFKFALLQGSNNYTYDGAFGTDSGVEKLITSMQKAQDKLKALRIDLASTLKSIGTGYSDPNSAKPIVDDKHLESLNAQYVHALRTIAELKNADDTTMASMKANAEKEIDSLKRMVREYQNAEYAATSLRTKDIGTIKTNQTNELNAFIAQINNAKIPLDTMTKDVEELKTALNGIGDKDSLTKFLNQFDNAKTKFESVKATYKTLIDSITQLQNLQNSSTFTKNASDPKVIQTKQEITQLLAEYQNLKTQMQGNITPAGLENIGNQLTQLNARFNTATATAKQFETELRNDNGAEKLAQRVALLKAQLEALAKANPKALARFGNEINSLMATLNNNPDARAVEQVAKDIQILRKEINNADLAGKTFFQKLKDNASKFTGWMSMTYAISLFTRSVREAVVELKEVDTLLTEISKANDKLTKSQLAEIGSNSFGIASKYGKTATDYLSGVQEMSRAGYTNAEAMGELSTAAQGAGDMTANVANQFIIAADKAYKMNGSVEQLTKTLDGINYITNNNAVNMSELSEGFSIVSSTAASFGVRADELTAALGTMAATTQQSGSEVARAFRAILLNIRQVSDEEEGIDAEGLTKYEKACNDLGVSLKEVKDGVLQLRNPMEVLKELSIEYNKLSETDLKRTNLLNSVGGKLRSTQLDALLRQWSMYEEMLQQYEAGNGSMAREAEKTASSWEGSLNRLSNSWTDFINGLVTSDTAKGVIDFLTTIIKNIDKLRDGIGTIPTLLGSIATVGAIKNVGELLNTPVYAQPQLICA